MKNADAIKVLQQMLLDSHARVLEYSMVKPSSDHTILVQLIGREKERQQAMTAAILSLDPNGKG